MTDPIWTWTHDIGSQSVHNQSLTSQEKTDINVGLNKIRHDTSHHGNVFRITDLCEGIHWWTAVPPNNGPVMQRFDVFYKLTWNRLVLMWRHCCKTSTFPAEIPRQYNVTMHAAGIMGPSRDPAACLNHQLTVTTQVWSGVKVKTSKVRADT